MDRWEAERAERHLCALRDIELPKGARVLDYGCGSRALTTLLAQRWPTAQVIGADISSTAVANARSRHGTDRLRFVEFDAAFVRERAGTFDFVSSHHVLEHVFDLPGAVSDLCTLLAAARAPAQVLVRCRRLAGPGDTSQPRPRPPKDLASGRAVAEGLRWQRGGRHRSTGLNQLALALPGRDPDNPRPRGA